MPQFVLKGALMLIFQNGTSGRMGMEKSTNQTVGVCPAMLIQFKYANVLRVAGGWKMRENKKAEHPNNN